ncbi:phage tail assembly protein T [Nocardiopsis alba]|uniref:phage tail assembly protein T n=1 Tax=Nocardiopsis alba TaxID=53437 RepID=UPI003D75EA07
MPVRELLARTDSAELTEWAAYEKVTGPLGPERADIHAGIIAATIANANSKKKHKPADFIPRWDKREQSWQEQLAAVRAANRSLGGTEVRRRGAPQ